MSNEKREVVVRIVKPSEQPQLPKRKSLSSPQRKRKKNLFQMILSGVLLVAATAICLFIAVNFFKIGIELKDILLLLGIPLVIGVAAGYVIS